MNTTQKRMMARMVAEYSHLDYLTDEDEALKLVEHLLSLLENEPSGSNAGTAGFVITKDVDAETGTSYQLDRQLLTAYEDGEYLDWT